MNQNARRAHFNQNLIERRGQRVCIRNIARITPGAFNRRLEIDEPLLVSRDHRDLITFGGKPSNECASGPGTDSRDDANL